MSESTMGDRISTVVLAGAIHLAAVILCVCGVLMAYWALHPTAFPEDGASRDLSIVFTVLWAVESTAGALLVFGPFFLRARQQNRRFAVYASVLSGVACSMAIGVAWSSLVSGARVLELSLFGVAAALGSVFALTAIGGPKSGRAPR